MNKKFLHAPVALTVEKKELLIAIPYLANLSLAIKTQNSINKNLPFCKINIVFNSTTRHSKFFRLKNKVPLNLYPNVVSCGRCNATYYSETCRHLNIRVGKHSGVSPLTRKKWKAKTTTAIKDQMLLSDHVVSLENFEILASVSQNFTLRSKKIKSFNSV